MQRNVMTVLNLRRLLEVKQRKKEEEADHIEDTQRG